MRLWPDTLAGQTLTLLISSTLLLIIGSALLLHNERIARFDEHNIFRLLERVATLAKLIGDADELERQRIIRNVAEPNDKITLSKQPWITTTPKHPVEKKIAHRLRHLLQHKDHTAIRVHAQRGPQRKPPPQKPPFKHPRFHELKGIVISIQLWDGEWLNFHSKGFDKTPPWASKTLQLLLLLLLLMIVSSLLITRRMTHPIAELADAAERFGLGRPLPPLPEKGPREVRHTIRTFNQMQARLRKHIADRSQMLAAVSHDLRTPITTLRLRAEYIEDPEMREKTLTTLAEMEAMLSATLNFARDEAADEQARATDLAALLQSLIDDHGDLGGDARYTGPVRFNTICRPIALKRAFNNLIENALKYGDCVIARLSSTTSGIEILIDDSGPGIPPDQQEAVVAPFYRMEASRNRETGGTGLGLAVAKSIILAHGGEMNLSNRPEGGLRVQVLLPHQKTHKKQTEKG
jgi:signal transduction histidine kinase